MKIAIIVEYNGKNYRGMQEQAGLKTIEGELRVAIENIVGHSIKLISSGRTDAGVSACNQVCHFETTKKMDMYKLKCAINVRLPDDIAVKSAKIVDDDFHARFDATQKTYTYKMYISDVVRPLKNETHLQLLPKINIKDMIECCKVFEGEHDFKAFCLPSKDITNYKRLVTNCQIIKNDDDYILYISGKGFLHNMVRVIVGALVSVGMGKISQQDILQAFETQKRILPFKTVRAEPLTLLKVEYEKHGELYE